MTRHTRLPAGWPAAFIVSSLALAACGISDDLFSPNGDRGDGGGTTPAPDDDGSTSATGGSASVTSSTNGSGGAGATTGVGASGAGGGSTSSGNMPSPLDCGGVTCPTGACCWDNYGLYGNPHGLCVSGSVEADGCSTTNPAENDPGYETLIECQTAKHCDANQFCCGKLESTQGYNYYEEVTCEASCSYPNIQLCGDAGDSTGCPELPLQGGGTVKGVCKPSQLLPEGYLVCGYP
jgi:hypothetical protein